MASQAKELVPFEPYLTQQNGLNALIVDRNLLALKKAISDANATIIRQQNIINRIISGDTIINFPIALTPRQGPPGMDAGDTDGPEPFAPPGPPGARGRDGLPGPAFSETTEDAIEPPWAPGAGSMAQARFWVSSPNPALPYAVDMSALGSGVLQQTVTAGVSVPNVVSIPGSTIPFGSGTNGQLTTDIRLGFFASELFLGTGLTQGWYNVDTASYERVEAFWSGNVFFLQSQKALAGTVRDMQIDAGTANAFLVGAVASVYGVNANNRVTASGTLGVELGASFTRASAAGMVLDAILLSNPANFSITGVTNITTATGVNFVTVRQPVYDGGGSAKVITNAATVYIAAAPLAQNGVTVTNSYALWVDADASRFDGNVFAAQAGGYLAVNGVAALSNSALAVGHTGDTNRDHVHLFVGGGSGYDSTNSYVDISVTNTSILGPLGIWATVRMRGYTISSGGGAPSVTEAATLYIDAAPTLTGVTGPTYAVHVAAGSVRIDGAVNNGGGAVPTLGTIGATGPTAAAQAKWIPLNSGGTQYWVPAWA